MHTEELITQKPLKSENTKGVVTTAEHAWYTVFWQLVQHFLLIEYCVLLENIHSQHVYSIFTGLWGTGVLDVFFPLLLNCDGCLPVSLLRKNKSDILKWVFLKNRVGEGLQMTFFTYLWTFSACMYFIRETKGHIFHGIIHYLSLQDNHHFSNPIWPSPSSLKWPPLAINNDHRSCWPLPLWSNIKSSVVQMATRKKIMVESTAFVVVIQTV